MLKVIAISAAFVLPATVSFAQSSTGGTASPQTNSGMTQPSGTDDKPKAYQPANPAPDTRSAPTSSSTGAGSDNGGRPEQQPKR
jgi:hypothetical protein